MPWGMSSKDTLLVDTDRKLGRIPASLLRPTCSLEKATQRAHQVRSMLGGGGKNDLHLLQLLSKSRVGTTHRADASRAKVCITEREKRLCFNLSPTIREMHDCIEWLIARPSTLDPPFRVFVRFSSVPTLVISRHRGRL